MKLYFCLALFFSSFAYSKISSCRSLNQSYKKNHSTKLIMQLKFFMQPPPSLFFPQIKSDKSFCLVSTGLALLPCFHYSGLMPDHIILLSSLFVQVVKFNFKWLRYMFTFFPPILLVSGISKCPLIYWRKVRPAMRAQSNLDFQREKAGIGGLEG